MKRLNIYDNFFSLKLLFGIIIFSVIFNIIYVHSTKFIKTIIVDEKHAYGSSNAKGSQSISDNEGNVYILKDSLYVLHWTSVELFNKLDENYKYEVEGHGVRLPILGWFPNITKAEKVS
jgi:hypothetical protein